MAKFPAAFLIIRLTSRKDIKVLAIVCSEIEGRERIYSYIVTVKYLLNPFAADNVIAKAASEIELIKKFFIGQQYILPKLKKTSSYAVMIHL